MHEVCGLTDPFCEHALGSKGATVSPQPTLSFQSRDVHTVTTGAAGYAGFSFNGGTYQEMLRSFSPGASTVTGPLTGNITPVTVAAALSNYGNGAWRINSVGVRWWDVGAATAVGGHCIVSVLADPHAFESGNWDLTAPIPGSKFEIRDRRRGGAVVLYPVDERADYFGPLSSATIYNAQDASDKYPIFQGFYLSVSGAASSLVLNVEVVINFEIIVTPGLGVGLASTPHHQSKHINMLVEYVRNQGRVFYENNKDQINRYIKSVITQGGKHLATGAMNMIMPGSGTTVRLLTN
jgi:hypothetical protein